MTVSPLHIDRLPSDPSGTLYAASDALLDRFPPKQIERVVESLIGKAPSYLAHAVSGAWMGT